MGVRLLVLVVDRADVIKLGVRSWEHVGGWRLEVGGLVSLCRPEDKERIQEPDPVQSGV